MKMQMAKAIEILNIYHGAGETKSSSIATPSEQIAPVNFTFPSIDTVVRSASSGRHMDSSNKSKINCSANSTHVISNSNNADLASVESTDTFMSCQTNPFLSQGDLTLHDDTFDMLNSMNDMNAMNSSATLPRGTAVSSSVGEKSKVKKSISGDTGLSGPSPIDHDLSGSHVSLNATPVPKHRKARFQQQQQIESNRDGKESFENLVFTNSNKKNRRASLMPAKIITPIYQHLFGITTKGNALIRAPENNMTRFISCRKRSSENIKINSEEKVGK